jgi:hypothetical protein
MYLNEADYREVLKKADAYKAIGQTRVYLGDGSVFPWDSVTKVEPGCSIRMEMATGVRLSAEVGGLQFEWSVDIEKREANGKGYFEIDVGICREILSKLPTAARQQLRTYFAECAGKVQEKGQEWQQIADRQKRAADLLHSLAIG